MLATDARGPELPVIPSGSQVGPRWVMGWSRVGPRWLPVGPLGSRNLTKCKVENRHRPEIRKIKPLGARGSDFEQYSMTFCAALFIKFHGPARCLFLLFMASHFGIKNSSKDLVFSRHLPGDHFWDSMLILCEKC